MYFIIPPKDKVWVASRDGLTRYNIEQLVKQADICISDLDETDCHSPSKYVAFDHWPQRMLKEKSYRIWLLDAVQQRLRSGRNAESASWKKYVETFLQRPEERAEILTMITPDVVLNSFYPGVTQFYSYISAPKCYVTKTIREIAALYAEMFGFWAIFPEITDKQTFMEAFVQRYPQFQQYLVRGDSSDDQNMVDVLRSCQRQQKIKSVLSIYVAPAPLQKHHNFDVETSRDHSGLVELLKE